MDEKYFMQKAISAAVAVKGGTYPNPPVGAVLVRDDEIIAIGATDPAGGAHAEVNCIRNAGVETEGTDLYVTLEPCSHHGKTPPCTDLILQSGIRRVFVACMDPNPLVSGKGFKRLREGGVTVINGLLEEPTYALLYRPFFHYIATGKPYVILKYAMTMDGKIAFHDGEQVKISGREAFEHVHILRKECDGVLVGAETVRRDNPSLDCRIPGIEDRFQPAAVVVSTVGMDEGDYAVIGRSRTIQAVVNGVGTDNHIVFDGSVDNLLTQLGDTGMVSLLVEGGRKILTQFIESKQIQEIHVFIAPKMIGGDFSPTGVIGDENAIIDLQGSWKQVGKDILFIGEISG